MTSDVGHGQRSSAIGLAQVCAAGLLWGTGGLVVTVLNDRHDLGAMTTSAWRMLVATAALLGLALVARRLGSVVATFRAQPALVVALGCCTAVYQALYFLSVLAVGVSVATVVSLGLAPVLAAAWEHTRAGTRPTAREVVVLVSALTGLVLVSVASAGHGGAGDAPVLGIVLAVASGAVYAATTVLGHHLARGIDPLALTTCATSVGAVALAPFLVVAALGSGPVISTEPDALALLVYLGVATMALSYGLLYAGLRTTSGSAATVATLVEPLSAAALAAILLDEQLTATAVVGGVLILAAVVGLRPRELPPAPT
ncbi:DMT family transporter [Aeromicrobium sp. Leaf350]|uniref:DMT family transporter n=1 Tax=Aeromicrobium sp. Leaf350 TaxID=2876565 RepID=UPI001E288BEC|nr:EamA family transporter [Aeromicrobium sp. Leaf350]